jgi:hypothetical protein
VNGTTKGNGMWKWGDVPRHFKTAYIYIYIYIVFGTMCPGVDSASKNEYQENSWE